MAIPVLMRKMPEVSEMEVTLVSVSCAKFNKEEYIVTSGQTNPLDCLMRSEMVSEELAAKKSLHWTNPSWVDQDQRLTIYLVNRGLLFRQVNATNASVPSSYHALVPVFTQFVLLYIFVHMD